MATPSLAMIPSGYKASKVYSVLPESGVGDFDFTRATTATRINSSGLIETVATNVPRLEYPLIDGVVNGCPSLLLEPQRTNSEIKSNGFSTWGTNSNITKTANYIVSPDGTSNGTRLQFTANGFTANTPQSLATYTISCYAKRNDSGTQNVGFFTNGSGVVNSAWEITSEWKRFSYTFPALNGSFMGIAGLSGADISVFGFQIEGLASYPTSYIPTNGSAVTRNAEVCDGAGNAATFNDSEGVLMAEISSFKGDNIDRQISLSNGSTSNRIVIALLANGTQIQFYVVSGGAVIVNQTKTIDTITDSTKMTFSYKLNDFKVYVNGFLILTDTSGAVPIGLNELAFDRGDGGEDYYGKTKQIQYYNSALTDSELEKLTSWTSFTDMAQAQQYSII